MSKTRDNPPDFEPLDDDQLDDDGADEITEQEPDRDELDTPQAPAVPAGWRGRPPAKPARAPIPATTPVYLLDLLALPGVDPEALAGVPCGTAWAHIKSLDGAARQMPLAHLAPDALETLAELGFEGHTTFEIREGQAGRVLRYFACRLDDLDDEIDEPGPGPAAAGAAGDGDLIQLVAKLTMQVEALKNRPSQPEADPMAGLEKAFAMFDRFSRMMQAHAPALPPQAGGMREIIDVIGQVAPLFTRQEQPQEPEPEEPHAD